MKSLSLLAGRTVAVLNILEVCHMLFAESNYCPFCLSKYLCMFDFLNKAIGIINFAKHFQNFIDVSKFQVGLKSLLRQGLSEPDFYGDLVYKLKKIVGSNNFSAQFIKIIFPL